MSGRRTPIVFITPVLPASRWNGLAMRAGLFLEGLSRRHPVTVAVVPVWGGHPDDGFVGRTADSCTMFRLADRSQARELATELLSTHAGRERAAEVYPLPAMCPILSRESGGELRTLTDGAALVHVMRTYLAPVIDHLLDAPGRPLLTLDLDELDSDVQRQLGNDREADCFERLERYYVPRFDRVFAASGEEVRRAADRYGADHVSVVANAVRRPSIPERPEPEFDLLFVGNLNYEPNVDAVRWLCGPIRSLLGANRIAIVGSGGASELRQLESTGVTVAVDVPDVGPWYAKSRVAVAPLRVGGGTRIKILEALAHGRPVVATSLAASGLLIGDRHGILTADRAPDFADACRRLLENEGQAARIGAAGRAQVIDAERIIEQIDALTESAG